ncbi:MAG: PEP-CTERM sorting domain-containing protein, partial [Gammaproteobacteria bacterium]|nr:PEP-CTERM sorting domain-containing protein [Gammaproteobacteria bacterium]
GVPYEMNSGPFANMLIDLAQAGDYRFVLDTSIGTHSPSSPLLTISLVGPMPMPAPGTLALIGLGLVIFVARRGRNRH